MTKTYSAHFAKNQIADERVSISEFFDLVGVRVYPARWSYKEIATFDQQSKPEPTNLNSSEYRAYHVSNELHHALQNGIFVAEVNFLGEEGAPPWFNGPELRYFSLKREAWVNGARPSWNRNTISFNSKYFDCPPYDQEVIEFFEDSDLVLPAYIRHPRQALANLIQVTNETLSKIARLKKFREHRWGEISAVIWRDLAVMDHDLAHGDRQQLVNKVKNYLDNFYSDIDYEQPSDSQLWKAVDYVVTQFVAKDFSLSVVPGFTNNPDKTKSRNSEST